MMDNVQKHSKCINMPLSQTFKSYFHFIPELKLLCQQLANEQLIY
jgi:hypothetical protein